MIPLHGRIHLPEHSEPAGVRATCEPRIVLSLSREQALAFRYAVQGLDRAAVSMDELTVLDLGVQDSPPGTSTSALAARLHAWEPLGERFALAWTIRGAPHLHRTDDLQELATQLRPLSESDVLARMPGMADRNTDEPALHVFDRVVLSLRSNSGGYSSSSAGTDRGAVSAAITDDMPEVAQWCRSCQATHIFQSTFLHAAAQAGVRLQRSGRQLRLVPLSPWTIPDTSHIETLIRTCLRLHGPATLPDTASLLGTSSTAIKHRWPSNLVAVSVDGRRMWARDEDLDDLRSAPPPRGVRLLPPSDPYLAHRHRALTVPDPENRKALWRPLGSPGALLIDGEVDGTWRATVSGSTLRVRVSPTKQLTTAQLQATESEAQRVALARGMKSAVLTFS